MCLNWTAHSRQETRKGPWSYFKDGVQNSAGMKEVKGNNEMRRVKWGQEWEGRAEEEVW